MGKVDCRYWDKCYQKNEHHLRKFNHPPKNNKNEGTPEKKSKSDVETKIDEPSKSKTESENIKTPKQEIDTSELRKEALSNIEGKNYMETLRKRIKLSIQAEYDELLKTNDFIRHKFLVEMPEEFYQFWNFISEKTKTNKLKPIEYLEKNFQITLVGPFDFLAGNFHGANIREPGDYLRHWRFYYDPPEFQTIFIKKGTGIHYGYWRDNPKDKENLLIARNDSSKGCEFEFIAGNSFDALIYYLDNDFKSTPFNSKLYSNYKKSLQNHYKENDQLKLNNFQTIKSEREPKVVTKTFHKAGIVVPVNSKTNVGYRPLIVSDIELKKILDLYESPVSGGESTDESGKCIVLEKLQPIITAASIAVDECDFGTSLELGIDFFCSGHPELHAISQSLVIPAYTLLQRPQFVAIFKAHLEDRNKNYNLSIFEIDNK